MAYKEWEGDVTIENIENVAERIRKLLEGRTFTIVDWSDYYDYEPDVRTRQLETLEALGGHEPVHTTYGDSNWAAGLVVHDTSASWFFSTGLKDGEKNRKYHNPHVLFERLGKVDRLTVNQVVGIYKEMVRVVTVT